MYKRQTSLATIALAATLLCTSLLGGCSTTEAFRKAADPLGTRIALDSVNYAERDGDATKQAEVSQKARALRTATGAGDKAATRRAWEGPDGLRPLYYVYVTTDKRSIELKQNKLRNIGAFDYILSLD